jgi:hypothetical protein
MMMTSRSSISIDAPLSGFVAKAGKGRETNPTLRGFGPSL